MQLGLQFASRRLPFIYGTAWKQDRTKELVRTAILTGFEKVDTAAQPKHYQEPLVGEAVRELIREGMLTRQDICLQTKYTTPAGQDLCDIPYDPSQPLETQIHTSVASSLRNLRPEQGSEEGSYIDCLLLHSPLPTTELTLQAWNILESYVPHKIRQLGISNTDLGVLQAIYNNSGVKPSVVQNRFYSRTQYDVALRDFCRKHDISYQSFWTLTGNPHLLQAEPVRHLARATNVSLPAALYTLVMEQGVVVLNGTTSSQHMVADLQHVALAQGWIAGEPNEWKEIHGAFRELIEPRSV